MKSKTLLNESEFRYTEKNFRYLKNKVQSLAGINLSNAKTALVYSRVSRLLRKYNLKDFDEYCHYLDQHDPMVEHEFINAITTNYTAFMRESHHFEYMKSLMLPEIIKRNHRSKRIRIWSAGCSTGEEAYSISFVIHDVIKNIKDWDIKILATDIDLDVLEIAKQGLYKGVDVEEISATHLRPRAKYFEIYDKQNNLYSVNPIYKQNVYFKYFNLMHHEQWPMQGPFDIVFCRNVLIYFDRTTQNEIIHKFYDLLGPKGYLILGHSESAPSSIQSKLRYIDKTIYQRIL